jgi:glycosyltransferase 2 family protein
MGRIEIALETPPNPPLAARPRRDLRRILPGVVISLICLALVLYFADIRRLGQALRLANIPLIILSIFITVSWLLVRGIVWRTLLMDQVPYRPVFLTLNEGYLINNLLPLRLGEIARAFLLSRKSTLGFWQVLSSIIIERSMDITMAVGLLLVSLPFVVGSTWAGNAALGAGVLAAGVFAMLYLLARFRGQALSRFNKLSERWPLLKRLGGRAVPTFFDGLAVLTDGKRFLKAVCWMVVNWGIAVLQYYVVLAAYYPSPKLIWVLFSISVAALGLAAPSSPGALGVMELSIVGSLSVFGLDPAKSLAFAFTLHLVQYLTTGVIGGYALAKDGESLASMYAHVRNIKENDPEHPSG